MTTQEFSIEFDILFNNINSNQSQGINEYEKSVFLTHAQNELIKNHFGMANNGREALNTSPYRDSEFSSLFKTISLNNGIVQDISPVQSLYPNRVKRFILENDYLFIINELCDIVKKDIDGNILDSIKTNVVPVHYAEFSRLMSTSYKEPKLNETWRLLGPQELENTTVMDLYIRYGYIIDNYIIRCVRKPRPIITVDLDGEFSELTIEGYNTKTECELHPVLHLAILKRAVVLADMSRLKQPDSQINPMNY